MNPSSIKVYISEEQCRDFEQDHSATHVGAPKEPQVSGVSWSRRGGDEWNNGRRE